MTKSPAKAKPPAIYLDHAAATPVDSAVLAAMQPYFQARFYNPSASYTAGQSVRQALTEARSVVAFWLGAKPSEVIFTAGGSEANNLAIHGVMRQYPQAKLLISSIEHESVTAPAKRHDYGVIRVHSDGRLNLDNLQKQLDDETVLVSVMYANNEIGTIQPIRQISRCLDAIKQDRRKRRVALPLYFHVDACQAANYLDLHVARLGVDLMSLNGGKIYGPKQSGALYVKKGLRLQPLIDGGGQELGLRSGTENVAGCVGFATALDQTQTIRRDESHRLQVLQKIFISQLVGQLPKVTINGSLKYRLPNNIHFTLPGTDNQRVMIHLDQAGIEAAAGSACSAARQEPSSVLAAIGQNPAAADSSLRLTIGRTTTTKMLEKTVSVLKAIIKSS